MNNDIDKDAKDQSAGDRGKRDLADDKLKTTDTRDQNDRDNEEVAIIIKIRALNHLKTADGDEAIKRNTDTTHDASRDRG